MNDKIRSLQQQIEDEKRKINNCQHYFAKPFYNPETVKEPYGYKMVTQGSDVWGEPEGIREVEKPRWTKKCQFCGYEQHTNKLKPIITGQEPDF